MPRAPPSELGQPRDKLRPTATSTPARTTTGDDQQPHTAVRQQNALNKQRTVVIRSASQDASSSKEKLQSRVCRTSRGDAPTELVAAPHDQLRTGTFAAHKYPSLLPEGTTLVHTNAASIAAALEGICDLVSDVASPQPIGVLGLSLLVCSASEAHDTLLTNTLGVTHVLCCCSSACTYLEEQNLVVMHVPFRSDNASPVLHCDATGAAFAFIANAVGDSFILDRTSAKPRVMIHCVSGTDVSPAIALGYAAVASRLNRGGLVKALRGSRPRILTRGAFATQLSRLDVDAWRTILGTQLHSDITLSSDTVGAPLYHSADSCGAATASEHRIADFSVADDFLYAAANGKVDEVHDIVSRRGCDVNARDKVCEIQLPLRLV